VGYKPTVGLSAFCSDQKEGPNMTTKQIIRDAIESNPEIRLILDIATRARELEEKSFPLELRASADVVAIPVKLQCAV
jgi:hypothetical protein